MNIAETITILGAVVALLGGISRLIAESRENRRYNEKTSDNIEKIKSDVEQIKSTADVNSELIAKTANGTKTLHRYRLFHDMQADIIKGYTTLERKREIAKLFESYKNLDGNGEIELLYHEFLELPLKGEENAPI
ncbi:hypothetical protein [Streptococcus sp. NLN76]|uniref:hypothetical protein n=1 Tax=Streptococcus sp. NLN76 TaxID=2822800 RepID=UPI0018A8E5EF|nr:hypothetical protein [Streptococcus sp. NLN76]MBF8970151.1 hypothetical protein [Streptococcus sp. NLN76]